MKRNAELLKQSKTPQTHSYHHDLERETKIDSSLGIPFVKLLGGTESNDSVMSRWLEFNKEWNTLQASVMVSLKMKCLSTSLTMCLGYFGHRKHSGT